MPPRLGAIAAPAHIAPLAAAIAAGIEEQPAAAPIVRAHPHAIQLLAGQQVRGRANDPPQHLIERFVRTVPRPIETTGCPG